jgi:hypothetical protein
MKQAIEFALQHKWFSLVSICLWQSMAPVGLFFLLIGLVFLVLL